MKKRILISEEQMAWVKRQINEGYNDPENSMHSKNGLTNVNASGGTDIDSPIGSRIGTDAFANILCRNVPTHLGGAGRFVTPDEDVELDDETEETIFGKLDKTCEDKRYNGRFVNENGLASQMVGINGGANAELNVLTDADGENDDNYIPETILQKLEVFIGSVRELNLNPKKQAAILNKVIADFDISNIPYTWRKELAMEIINGGQDMQDDNQNIK